MKIVVVNKYPFGGAARACFRLCDGLSQCDVSPHLVVTSATKDLPRPVQRFRAPTRLSVRLRRGAIRTWLKRRSERYAATRSRLWEGVAQDRSEHAADLADQLPPCDVINLHWVDGAFDYEAFLPRAARLAPVVWTLHDMHAFTGGCYYDYGCGRFKDKCGCCPLLGSTEAEDLSRNVWQGKRRAFRFFGSRTAVLRCAESLAVRGRACQQPDRPIRVSLDSKRH